MKYTDLPEQITHNPTGYLSTQSSLEKEIESEKYLIHEHYLAGYRIGEGRTLLRPENRLIAPSSFNPFKELTEIRNHNSLRLLANYQSVQNALTFLPEEAFKNYSILVHKGQEQYDLLSQLGLIDEEENIESSLGISLVPVREYMRKHNTTVKPS